MANTFNCPSCGAPLEIEGESLSIVCKYCGDTVAVPEEFRPHPTPAPAPAPEVSYLPPEDENEPVYVPPANNNRAMATVIIISLGLIMFYLLVTSTKKPAPLPANYNYATSPVRSTGNSPYAVLTQVYGDGATQQALDSARQQAQAATAQAFSAAATLTATNAPETLYTHRVYSPVIFPADSTSPYPDFLVQDYDGYYDWADGSRQTLAWESAALTGRGPQTRAFIVDKQALIMDLASLSAVDLQTGKLDWKAALPNGLGNCATCLVKSGSALLVLLKDGTLQALDAASGSLTWHKSLKGTYSDIFLAGGLPALTVQDGGRVGVSVLDPLTGNVSKNIQPTCLGGAKISAVTNVVDLGSGKKELFVLGEGCLQIISLPDGKVTAQVSDRQFADHPESIWFGNSYLVSADAVYYASASKAVDALDLTSGASRELFADPGSDLKPLMLWNKLLVVDTKPGASGPHIYWGIDPASGQSVWTLPVDGQAVVHFLSNGNVFVYKWQLGTHEWTSLNPQTGVDVYQTSVMSGGGLSYEFSWYKDTVYIIRDHRLIIMDALTGNSPTGQQILY